MKTEYHDIKLISVPDAAGILGVSARTVARLIADGQLQIVKVGRLTRIRVVEVEEFIASSTMKARAFI